MIVSRRPRSWERLASIWYRAYRAENAAETLATRTFDDAVCRRARVRAERYRRVRIQAEAAATAIKPLPIPAPRHPRPWPARQSQEVTAQ